MFIAAPPPEGHAVGVGGVGYDEQDALHRDVARALFSRPSERFPTHGGRALLHSVVSAPQSHRLAVRVGRLRQVGGQSLTACVSAVMLPQPIGIKPAATRPRDPGIGLSTIASPFRVDSATRPEEGAIQQTNCACQAKTMVSA